ncbi:MAG: hypothetical protein HGA31_06425 [Candidatus Moranbacteria bacterium]|nr:hypothetical protein [Candidatus Moranbacteria bacterium]
MSIFAGRLYPITADCGHKTWLKGRVHAHDEFCVTRIPITDGHTPYCHACLEKMAIRCAWCGKPIFVGDPITLYSPKKGFEIPDYAIRYSEDPLTLVGCLRWDCAESGMDRSGFWMPPGQVVRVMNAYEQIMATGTAVVVNDLGDFKEAVETTRKHAPPEEQP